VLRQPNTDVEPLLTVLLNFSVPVFRQRTRKQYRKNWRNRKTGMRRERIPDSTNIVAKRRRKRFSSRSRPSYESDVQGRRIFNYRREIGRHGRLQLHGQERRRCNRLERDAYRFRYEPYFLTYARYTFCLIVLLQKPRGTEVYY